MTEVADTKWKKYISFLKFNLVEIRPGRFKYCAVRFFPYEFSFISYYFQFCSQEKYNSQNEDTQKYTVYM